MSSQNGRNVKGRNHRKVTISLRFGSEPIAFMGAKPSNANLHTRLLALSSLPTLQCHASHQMTGVRPACFVGSGRPDFGRLQKSASLRGCSLKRLGAMVMKDFCECFVRKEPGVGRRLKPVCATPSTAL